MLLKGLWFSSTPKVGDLRILIFKRGSGASWAYLTTWVGYLTFVHFGVSCAGSLILQGRAPNYFGSGFLLMGLSHKLHRAVAALNYFVMLIWYLLIWRNEKKQAMFAAQYNGGNWLIYVSTWIKHLLPSILCFADMCFSD